MGALKKSRKYLLILVVILALIYAMDRFSPQDLGIDFEGMIDDNEGNKDNRPVQDVGSIEVHFCPVEDCATIITAAVEESDTIQCAFYELGLPGLIAALEEKVTSDDESVVLVFDEEAEDLPGSFTRIPARHGGLMHNKFCVLEQGKRRFTITGSMNPTENGAHKNDNNLLIIESGAIAGNYYEEFYELLKDTESKNGFLFINLTTPNGSVMVENYFCPEDACEERVLSTIINAEEEILFMTFSFTSDNAGVSLTKKIEEGVVVRGVFEARQKSQYSEHETLIAAGADIRFDGNPQTMHHKIFIIDPDDPERATIITGSYNPTANGNTRNDENLLIIHDQAIARQFVSEFERVWTVAK